MANANDAFASFFRGQRLPQGLNSRRPGVRQGDCDKSAAEIISHIMDAIRTFTEGAEQSDDLTIVVVRVAP